LTKHRTAPICSVALADLPVYRTTKIELIVNMNTAKALGITAPPGLLAGANEVNE
jgi:putative ABC transport system substrate-binding protein